MKIQRTSVLKIMLFSLLLIFRLQASAYYDPGVQRWINRDPIIERAQVTAPGWLWLVPPDGPNEFSFVGNDGVNQLDAFGETSVLDNLDDPNSKNKQDSRQLTECEKAKKKQECLDDCDSNKDDDDDFCRSLPNRTKLDKRKREYCWRMAMERYARCRAECNKQWQ